MLGYSFHFIVSIIVSFTNSVMDKKYSTFVRLLASSHSSVQKANRKNTHHGVASTRRLEFFIKQHSCSLQTHARRGKPQIKSVEMAHPALATKSADLLLNAVF